MEQRRRRLANGRVNALPKQTEGQYFKTTFRFLFAICTIASIYLSERFIFPFALKVSWQGTIFEEALFVALTWFISSLIVGLATVGIALLYIMRIVQANSSDANSGVDKPQLAKEFFKGSAARWFMSLSPCVGPPLAFLIISPLYSSQLYFPDVMTLAQAALLLGCCSFMISLPLTLDAQRSLGARVQERFGVDIDGEKSGEQVVDEIMEEIDRHADATAKNVEDQDSQESPDRYEQQDSTDFDDDKKKTI